MPVYFPGSGLPAGVKALGVKTTSDGGVVNLIDPRDGSALTPSDLGWDVAGGGGSDVWQTPSGLVLNDTSPSARATNATILNAFFSTPGLKAFPIGDICTDPFSITATCRVIGQGASSGYGPINTAEANVAAEVAQTAATILRFVTTATDCITVLASGVEFAGGIHFMNRAAAEGGTAGAMIRVGNSGTAADAFKIHHCTSNGFWAVVDFNNSVGYSVHDNIFWSYRKYGVWIRNLSHVDEGDPSIHNNWLSSAVGADAGIYFKAGGGLKIVGNKIWRAPPALMTTATQWHKKGLWIDNPTGNTSVLTVCGNSIEACHEQAIFVDCSTGGAYQNITIQGNQFSAQGWTTGNFLIEIKGRAAQQVAGVIIGGNTAYGTRCLRLEYAEGCIEPNTWRAPNGLIVSLGAKTSAVAVHKQSVTSPGGEGAPFGSRIFLQDEDIYRAYTSYDIRAHRDLQFVRELATDGLYPIAGTYKTMFKFIVCGYASAEMDLTINASSSANGQATLKIGRIFANENAAITVGESRPDVGIARVGGVTAVQALTPSVLNPTCGDLDVLISTQANVEINGGILVTVQVKLKAGAVGTGLKGMVQMSLNGGIYRVQRGD